MNEKLKVAVFGVGSLGQWHARIYSEIENAELVGVYDVDEERAKEIAERYKTQPFSDIEELAKICEAASIAVPTDIHHDIFNQLLPHKLHLMMEKPIASTSAQAESMVNNARDNDLILQVGHVERFNPVMAYLEEQLDHPRFIEAIRIAPYPPPREGLRPRGTEVSVVLDLMIHDLDIILHLVKSPVKEVRATGVAVLSPTEDIANVRLAFENGCVANVTASRISQEQLRKIRVFQEDTYVSLDYKNQVGQLAKKSSSGIEVSDVPINKDEPLLQELVSFVECVRHKDEPRVTGEHGSEALKLAVRICEEIRNNPS
ncbi:oxidoreductase [bacterium E08(2017)]|nr:oxidoreductase [bacterium E08(2017)]